MEDTSQNKSPFKIIETVVDTAGMRDIHDIDDAKAIKSILGILGDYSVAGAIEILELSKRAVLECTQLHDEYDV